MALQSQAVSWTHDFINPSLTGISKFHRINLKGVLRWMRIAMYPFLVLHILKLPSSPRENDIILLSNAAFNFYLCPLISSSIPFDLVSSISPSLHCINLCKCSYPLLVRGLHTSWALVIILNLEIILASYILSQAWLYSSYHITSAETRSQWNGIPGLFFLPLLFLSPLQDTCLAESPLSLFFIVILYQPAAHTTRAYGLESPTFLLAS